MLKNKRGFTLIELLVVIAIIGTLSGIVLVSLGSARARARDAVRMSDMRQLVSAQELYYGINEVYYSVAASQDDIPAISTYLPILSDPQATRDYRFLKNDACNPAGQFFCAYTDLEDEGTCTGATPNRIFVSYQTGTKEECVSASPTEPSDGCGCATTPLGW